MIKEQLFDNSTKTPASSDCFFMHYPLKIYTVNNIILIYEKDRK